MSSRLRSNLAVAAACLAITIAMGTWSRYWGLWFALGLLWAQFAEYAWHRFVLHGPPSAARLQHSEHHRAFRAEPTVAIDDIEAQDGISEHPSVFPSAFAVHLAVFFFLAGGFPLAFMAAICIHYAAFELSHWAIHVRENPIDRVLRHVPGVRYLRGRQILHHFEHHEFPHHNFGFTPPFVGDALFQSRKDR